MSDDPFRRVSGDRAEAIALLMYVGERCPLCERVLDVVRDDLVCVPVDDENRPGHRACWMARKQREAREKGLNPASHEVTPEEERYFEDALRILDGVEAT
jgi:hypothetical protein